VSFYFLMIRFKFFRLYFYSNHGSFNDFFCSFFVFCLFSLLNYREQLILNIFQINMFMEEI